MKLTRRDLVAAAAGAVLAAKAQAQPAGVPDGERDFSKEARDAAQRNADAVAKLQVPMATEPAFQFKA